MNTKRSNPLMTAMAACLAILYATITTSMAAAPDLTAGGVPDETPAVTINLGPTGARGWVYHVKTDTSESRQILVTDVDSGSPAAGTLAIDDVILGANGTGSNPSNFSSDARKSLALAIADAEANSPATLKLLRWRSGSTTTVTLTLQTLGAYTATAPYNCPKSALILQNGQQYVYNNEDSGRYSFGAITLLATDNASYEAKAQTEAVALIPSQATMTQMMSDDHDTSTMICWERGHTLVFLAEYYLATGDAQVLPAIEAYAVNIAKNQSLFGTVGHKYANKWPDGSANGPMGGVYGVVNSAGMPCFLGVLLAKECGLTNPELDPAIEASSRFFAYYSGKGAIPYGEHEPYLAHESNGKCGLAALYFGLQDNRVDEGKFFAKMATAATNERESGHTGAFFNYLWSPLGAAAGGEEAAAAHFSGISWMLDLNRRWDGGFDYDCLTGEGPNSGSEYNNFRMSSAALLTYALPHRNLTITGKGHDPARYLSSADVTEAVQASDYDADSRTDSELISDLGNWSPKVRKEASQQLGNSSIDASELSQITAIANDTGASSLVRAAACIALGEIGDSSSSAPLAALLTDSENYVRWGAAEGMRYLPRSANLVHVDTILAAAASTADPLYPLNDEDPLHFAHSKLGMLLFYSWSAFGPKGILWDGVDGIDRNLLYPAIEAISQTPVGLSRGTLEKTYDNLTYDDVLAMSGSIVDSIINRAPADKMFSNGVRRGGVAALQKHGIAEGVPASMAFAADEEGGRRKEGLALLGTFGGSVYTVEPDHDVIGFLNSYVSISETSSTAQAALDAIAADTNPATLTALKSIQSVTADASTVTMPTNFTTLRVTASDDAQGDSVYTWTKVSGPGSVTFTPNGTAAAVDSTVQFDGTPGSYQFEVTMSDSRGLTEAYETVSVTLDDNSGPSSSLKVFILAGQSNMEGHGEMDPVGTQGTLEYLFNNDPATYGHLKDGANWAVRDDAWIWYKRGGTTTLNGGVSVGYGALTDTVGPELQFGHVMGDAYGEQVLIIKTAWGGKSLATDFRPPTSGWSVTPPAAAGDQGYYYQEMLNYVNDVLTNLPTYFPEYNAANGYELAGFGWHQGWNDRVNQADNDEYEANMENFINDVRTDLGAPNLPFVIGTTGMSGWADTHPRALSLMAAQLAMEDFVKYPAFNGNVAVFDTRDFFRDSSVSPASQDYHWNRNAETYYLIGQSMAQEMQTLIGGGSGGGDIIPPTLVGTGIVDDQSGSSIYETTTVLYTVSFSEAMNAATIGTDDFENGGSPATTINSVATTGDPAVFEVSVTPSGAGTLQLQIKSGAILEDLAGNALDTASAIADDTMITVVVASGGVTLLTSNEGEGPGGSGDKTLVTGYDASAADKLVVVLGAEDGNPGSTGGVFNSVTYGGVALTEAVQEEAGVPTLAIFYLDDPGAAGDIVVSQGGHNGTLYTIYQLVGTASGVGSTNVSTGNSVNLTTTASNSLVIAGILDAGPAGGNGAPNLTADAPLTEDTLTDLEVGSRWTSLSAGSATVANPGAGTYSFSNAGGTDLLAIGVVEFLPGGVPPDTTPPTPNPASFAVAPAADDSTSISMTASPGSDPSGPVEYLFTETSGNPGGANSGWQASLSYTDSGLNASTQYTYTITMRDSLGNTGTASSGSSATTQDPPDTTPPTLAGTDIVDDQSGSSIFEYESVLYTVTFNEPMNAATIGSDDFENAGSPAATINSVATTGDPAVFEVSVTPGGTGTLQLQVKSGAVLEDIAGNALDTASAITDDTIITVDAAPAGVTLLAFSEGSGPGGAGDKTIATSYDASTADKLVVVLGAEHGFSGNTGGIFNSVTYGGTAFTEAVQEEAGVPTLAIFYLDDPGAAGDIVINQGNHNGFVFTIYQLVGTEAGVGATNKATSNSVSLTTTANGSYVIAGILDAGPAGGNNAPNLTADAPLSEDTVTDLYGGSRYVSMSTGSAIVATAGAGTYSFSNAGGTDLLAIAAVEFLAPAAMEPTIYEMEDGVVSGANIASSNAGFTGTGFVDYASSTGDNVVLTVNVPSSGIYDISYRYALSAGDRPLEIKVNGQVVDASLSFPGTGGWTTWAYTETVPVSLNAGDNTVTATAIGSSGGNVDHLLVAAAGAPVADPVPDVVGLSQVNAEAAIVAAGYTVGTITTAYSDTVAAGDVISQSPAAGIPAAAGSPVAIEVSLGVEMITVPNVTGLTQTAAEAAILAENLSVGNVTTEYSDTVSEDDVISQGLTAGSSVPHSTAVDLVVSLGVEMVTVPNVTGLSQTAAETAILAENLSVGNVTTEYSDTVSENDVISQGLTAGSSVPHSTAVDLVVSLGVLHVNVPDVVGLSQSAAESSITGAILTVGNITSEYSATVPTADVISQGLSAGSSVPHSSAVDLTISLGIDPSPKLVRTTVNSVSNGSWTTVNLGQTYNSAVIVATPIYTNNTDPSVVTRITNVTSTGFDLKIDRADGLTDPITIDVSVIAIDEGIYTQAVDGVTMEAVKYTSTVTAGKSNWVADSRTYQNSYTTPVVVGQVMSANDSNWSAFWSMGSSQTNPVDASNLNVGKHIGEDTNTTRADETIGYIVIESGSGIINGVAYEAALGADTVRGFDDSSTPYTYSLSGGLTSASAAAVSISAMDGNNGAWGVLAGNPALTTTSIGMYALEDQVKDSERKHTTAQMSYIVFE